MKPVLNKSVEIRNLVDVYGFLSYGCRVFARIKQQYSPVTGFSPYF